MLLEEERGACGGGAVVVELAVAGVGGPVVGLGAADLVYRQS